MRSQDKQTLFDIQRMVQQIPMRSGRLPDGCNWNTKFGIGLEDYPSAKRLGLKDWVSVMDIVELLWNLVNFPVPTPKKIE